MTPPPDRDRFLAIAGDLVREFGRVSIGGGLWTSRSAATMVTSNRRASNRRAALLNPFDTPSWRIDDELIHLREWGTAIVYPLSSGRGRTGAIIGAARNSWIRIKAPGVAPQLARLARAGSRWILRDLRGLAGVRLDGIAHSVGSLSPGSEIEIGGIRLIAESPRLVALREALARFLGWAPERAAAVDGALRAVRTAALHPLFLCGIEGDVFPAARLLHQHTLGNAPFVICAPGRRVKRIVYGEITINNADNALRAAAGGTLCIWQGPQLAKLITTVPRPTWPAQIMVCTSLPRQTDVLFRSQIALPALRRRVTELDRIINEYLVDACAELGGTFLPIDRARIRRYDSVTHARIASAARRIVVLRGNGGSIVRAARVLRMAHGALSEWVARRKIPDLTAAD